jgi:two-component system sensor histidine kinase KdpD
MPDREGRPSPEALLRTVHAEGRGRLKIFLGAAPGVGKTYEMLSTARARQHDGVDVVVGIVETHGRAETEALLAGLTVLPRRVEDYKGHPIEEMDLDALLARHPALALVDELAHRNAPGSRHPKRYLDVQELLAAGIDVFTTMNIQHVESLNDVVAQITRIRVRETVPDSIIDGADDVEMIDLTPEDLLARLRDGKVYLPKTAKRAMSHYFSPGNLTALRELALRRTAQSVDVQLLDHMQAHAIPGPWSAGDKVLVCITRRGAGEALVRAGRRLAGGLRAPWAALHVETPRSLRLPEAERDHIAESMRMAERLGAETVTIPGRNVAADILAYARENNFSHIVLGNPGHGRWLGLLRGSVVADVVAGAGDIPVHIAGHIAEPRHARTPLPRERLEARPYAVSTALVAGATSIGFVLQQFLGLTSISLVFLTAVLAAAAAFGRLPSLYASLLAVLAYNFFFLPPLYTFTVADPENVVTLFFFFVVAGITSNLSSRMREQALAARQRARTTEDLYQFSRKLAGVASRDDVLWATAYQVASMLKMRVVLLLPEGESVAVQAGYPPEDELDEADLAAAKWCWQHNREAGRGADTLPGAKRLFLPLRTGRGPVGVVGIDSDRPGALLTPDQRRLLDALTDQAAIAIERVTLADDVDRARLEAETERLRAALLTSISHDLRTPLAAILGAATSLESYGALLDPATRKDLLRTIQDEAERLNRFVGNLLDMTRLESGALAPRREPADLGEVIGSALARAGKVLADRHITLELAPDLPLAELDVVLFEQVLFNLLDNVGKYTPAGSTVTLRAWHETVVAGQGRMCLQVIDEGPGIPPDALERIFDKFYRLHGPDHQPAGTGLGLSICRGFVRAMGGDITAANRQDRSGAVFTISLPTSDAAPSPGEGATQKPAGDKLAP